MMRPLLVIDPAIRTPATAARLRLEALDDAAGVRTLCPALGQTAELLAVDPVTVAGIVVLGSAASVNDAAPWLDALRTWLRPVLYGGQVPVLGICFGHQLLAQILGGEVAPLFPVASKGVRTFTLDTTPLPWWTGRSATVSLFHSHGEAVVTVPPGARVLATSAVMLPDGEEARIVEALGYDGLPIWGFQPHPESTPAFLIEQGCEALLSHPGTADCLRDGWDIVTAFVGYCRSQDVFTAAVGSDDGTGIAVAVPGVLAD